MGCLAGHGTARHTGTGLSAVRGEVLLAHPRNGPGQATGATLEEAGEAMTWTRPSPVVSTGGNRLRR